MANFASRSCKISKQEFKKVGDKKIPLLDLELMEPIRKKNDNGDWETTGHNFFEAQIWGEAATKGAIELTEGTVIDLSPEIMDSENGQWVKYRATLDDNSWKYEGKEYHKAIVKIWTYKIKD